jgi:hypothetical protein
MEPNQEETLLQMHLDYDGGHILHETVRWSRFLSIVGFIGLGIFVLIVAVMGTALSALYSRYLPGIDTMGGIGVAILIVVLLVCLAIGGLLVVMLYRFSTLTRRGIDHQDRVTFAAGMRCLKIYFLVSGILGLLSLLNSLFSLTQLFHS